MPWYSFLCVNPACSLLGFYAIWVKLLIKCGQVLAIMSSNIFLPSPQCLSPSPTACMLDWGLFHKSVPPPTFFSLC